MLVNTCSCLFHCSYISAALLLKPFTNVNLFDPLNNAISRKGNSEKFSNLLNTHALENGGAVIRNMLHKKNSEHSREL